MPAISSANGAGKQTAADSVMSHVADQRKCQTLIVVFMALLAGLLFLYDKSGAEPSNGGGDVLEAVGMDGHVKVKIGHRAKRNDKADGVCFTICDAYRKLTTERFGGDFTNISHVPEMIEKATKRSIENLHKQYGKETFEAMYVKDDVEGSVDPRIPYRTWSTARPKTGLSIDRMVRKLLLKIVNAQIEFEKSFRDVDGCDCTNGKAKAVGDVPEHADNATEYLFKANSSTFTKYVWATGGHSAAAGHGNLFNETYTVFLERAVSNIFQAVGIEFEARNYAMGGTGSGPEISMCHREIFGDDVDALSWDYGMTDGDRYYRLLHYMYRAGLESWPAIVGMHAGGRQGGGRTDRFQRIEDLGMPVFTTIDSEVGQLFGGIPDTSGKSTEEINQMPPMIKSFKCQGQIEKGDPGCGDEKYNMALCPNRRARAGWHPGFKHHAMDGNRIATLFFHLLKEAVTSDRYLKSKKSLESLRDELQKEDEDEREKFINAPLPDVYTELNYQKDDAITDEISKIMFQNPNICHTARLPAKTRFNGILTEHLDKVGGQAPVGKEKYFTGMMKEDADKEKSPDGKMRLVWEIGKQREMSCPVAAKPDYKDWFYATHNDGPVSLTVPNAAERAAYKYDPESVKGLIVLCTVMCDWGRCPAGDTNLDGLAGAGTDITTIAKMHVNGQLVTKLHRMESCVLLGSDSGPFFTKKPDDGTFELQVEMVQPGSYLRLSTMIVY